MRLLLFAWLALLMASSGIVLGSCGGKDKKDSNPLARTLQDGDRSAWPGSNTKLRVITLSVYADTDYVRGVPRWKARFRNLVARANQVLGPLLDLRLEVDSVKTWSRKAAVADRQALLLELRALDPGKQMRFVVGLLPSLPKAAQSYDEMGAAILGGRHIVLRSVDTVADVGTPNSFERGWKNLSSAERNKLYLERKRHRELVVLLHELGHLFGVAHHADRTGIMYKHYQPDQREFLPASAASMRGALVEELAGTRDDLAERRAAERLADARQRARRALDAAHRAKTADDAGQHLQEAEAILGRYDGQLSALWAQVAAAYREINHVTLAEQALLRAGPHATTEVKRWARRTRARFAIPANAASLGLTPANEAEYITSYNAIVAAIAEDEAGKAKRLILAGTKLHGDLPGFDVLLCDLAMRGQKYKRAQRLCASALSRCETASWAHFLAGHLRLRKKDRAGAEGHFARAVELDPELAPARRALAKLRGQ